MTATWEAVSCAKTRVDPSSKKLLKHLTSWNSTRYNIFHFNRDYTLHLLKFGETYFIYMI